MPPFLSLKKEGIWKLTTLSWDRDFLILMDQTVKQTFVSTDDKKCRAFLTKQFVIRWPPQ